MAWKVKDVDTYVKNLSDDQKEVWVEVANKALKKCLDAGGTDEKCAPKAIKVANAAVSKSSSKTDDSDDGAEDKSKEKEYQELDDSLLSLLKVVQRAFYSKFESNAWVRDIFIDHPKLSTCVVVETDDGLYKVGLSIEQDNVVFDTRDMWTRVKIVYEEVAVAKESQGTDSVEETKKVEPINENFKERATGAALRIVERSTADESIVPLAIDVQIIHPGFGNKHDNHYYSAEMLKECSPVFEGVKMYETDHRQEEKSTRTWVSTIKHVEGFTENGAPIGRVIIHDETFAKKIIALNEAELLGKMECSILASGIAKRGKVDGKEAKVVESIDLVESVDWVTRAGAGGKAIKLAESKKDIEKEQDANIEEIERVTIQERALDAKIITAILDKVKLPKATLAKLQQAEYANVDALEAAIKAEREYIKEVSGGATVFGMGGEPAQEKKVGFEERINEIMQRHGSTAINEFSEVN